MKNQMKGKNGITLIALVITIIVLLILAGVTIATLTGDNGLLKKATDAKHANEENEVLEKIKLVYAEYQIGQYSTEVDVEDSLREIFGNNVSRVSINNGKLIATINGKTYRYNSKTGVAEEYIDPFNYGNKSPETVVAGDNITLTKESVTESFMIISNVNEKIVAMPHYNLIQSEGKVKQSNASTYNSAISQPFSNTYYWMENQEWRDNAVESAIDVDMFAKNSDGTYKNNIQQYIDAYKETLENMGADGITVRIGLKYELDTGLNEITDQSKKNIIRNPSNKGYFWMGSAYTGDTSGSVYFIKSDGTITRSDTRFNDAWGIRPVIEFLY